MKIKSLLATVEILLTLTLSISLTFAVLSVISTAFDDKIDILVNTDLSKTEPYVSIERDAEHVLLYDITNEKILYFTGNKKVFPASTTKLLTLYFALDVLPGDTVLTVSSEINIAPADSSKAHIQIGDRYTLKDIAAALLLPSGNDAAYTLAVTCGRYISENESLSNLEALEVFMDSLNEFALKNGLKNTHFVTPDGYHDPNHVTTMRDLLDIALLARENDLMRELMNTQKYTAHELDGKRELVWENSNSLLFEASEYYYIYATGIKTGFHTPAGACLIASAEKDGRELMVLIFKCEDKNGRFIDAKNFLEAGFSGK